MPDFKFVAPFEPTGDQPAAIERLTDGLAKGVRHQTLLGATGTGKTATLAWTIAQHNKPTLVLAHNKTLAAQLYAEFREFFPENAVEYFVSYFDYYQPEAYLPRIGHVHREGLVAQRRDRPAPPCRDPRALRAARRDHRGQRRRASTASAPRWTTAPRCSSCASAASTGATRSSATSSISSTSATTRRSPAPGSASAATPSSSSRRRRRRWSGSSSSATRSSGSPSSTR